jgi:PAS domain S-box-containing protein
MELHPGQSKRHVPEVKSVESDPIRRALQENEDWYRDLVEHSHDLLCIHDLQGRLLSVNPSPARVLGYSVEELLKIPMREIIAPEFRTQFDAYLAQVGSKGEARGLMAVMTRTGERRVWEYYNTLRTDGVASPIVRGMGHDITERIRAERGLRQREDELKRAQAVAHTGSWSYNILKHAVSFSDETYRIMGLPVGSLLTPESSMDVIHPEDHGLVKKGWEAALRAGHFDLEHRVRVRGNTQWVQTKADIEFDEDRRPVEAVGTVQDITDRKHADERLKEYEKALEGLDEMIAVVDRDYRYVIVNHAFLRYRNVERDQIIGRLVSEVLGEDFFESVVKEKLDSCFQGKNVKYELRYVYPTLGARDLFASYLPIEGPSGVDRVACVLWDITERKRAVAALEASENRFRIVYERSPVGMCLTETRTGRFLQVNPQFCEIVGRTAEDLLNRDVQSITHSDDVADSVEKMRQLADGELQRFEMEKRYLRTDGSIRWVNVLVVRMCAGDDASIWNMAIVQDVTELREVTEQLRRAKEKLTEEKLYLEQEIHSELGFGEIVGQSQALKAVMEQVGHVASSDATVLLLGETGTGKELIARAIHQRSTRKSSSFIKVNCAAIPSGLLESELFGHEKGAFTGAVSKKIGRLELADRGTLFHDEIGEIPLALQPKLLRVLQDQEFERLGGTQTLKVDFRLIAATNRDLSESMKEKQFRSDLYYRLNVFPVRVPLLRERREDIPFLVEHFVQRFASRMNRAITSIPKKTMETLMQWNWPGNVRELENFIERSVILTHGSVLAAPINELIVIREVGSGDSLKAKEREHILHALEQSRGQISGPRGAAARLGLPRSTLQWKLKQLGINHEQYRD